MGSLPIPLVDRLRDELNLLDAVETGTYKGGTSALLARHFRRATSIELSPELHRAAVEGLASLQNLTLLLGNSPELLSSLERPTAGRLFWLDAHWSGLDTAGRENPCPVLDEVEAIGAGHPDDCLLIDDARLFNSPDWPRLIDVMNRIREIRPDHHVTVVHDLIVAVPRRVRPVVDAFSRRAGDATFRAAEEGRLGRRTARINRVVVHPAFTTLVYPAYVTVMTRLVQIKQRLVGSRN
jgi:hypothetical protein